MTFLYTWINCLFLLLLTLKVSLPTSDCRFRLSDQNVHLWPTLKRIGSPGLRPSSPTLSWCCFRARFWIIFCKQERVFNCEANFSTTKKDFFLLMTPWCCFRARFWIIFCKQERFLTVKSILQKSFFAQSKGLSTTYCLQSISKLCPKIARNRVEHYHWTLSLNILHIAKSEKQFLWQKITWGFTWIINKE